MNDDQLLIKLQNIDARIIQCSDFHFQLKGICYTVNFYPSKKTYFVNGAVAKNYYRNIKFLVNIADGKQNANISIVKCKRKKLSDAIKNKLQNKYSACCYCNKIFNETNIATIEHLIPLSLGGSNRFDNLALSCKECNHKKGCSLKVS